MTQYIIEAVFVLLVGLGLLAVVPNPLRAGVRGLIRIKAGQIHEATTTPIERELALIAAPQKIIEESQRQVKDLQGKLVHQRNVLEQRKDDQRQAEDAYYKSVDEKSGDYAVQEFLALVADKDQEVSIEQQVYDSLEQAVSVSLGAFLLPLVNCAQYRSRSSPTEARGVAATRPSATPRRLSNREEHRQRRQHLAEREPCCAGGVRARSRVVRYGTGHTSRAGNP